MKRSKFSGSRENKKVPSYAKKAKRSPSTPSTPSPSLIVSSSTSTPARSPTISNMSSTTLTSTDQLISNEHEIPNQDEESISIAAQIATNMLTYNETGEIALPFLDDDISLFNNISGESKEKTLNKLLRTSMFTWLLRSKIVIPSKSREDGMKETIASFQEHGAKVGESLKNLCVYLSADGKIFRDVATAEFARICRCCRDSTRKYLNVLCIKQKSFENEMNWIWKRDYSIESVKSISPYFATIESENMHSLFPIICCYMAIFSCPITATSAMNKLYRMIIKLLKGESVKTKAIFGVLTIPFMSYIASLLLQLNSNDMLKRGPQSPTQEGSIFLTATSIAKIILNEKISMPDQIKGVPIPKLLELIDKRIAKIQRAIIKKSVTENHISIMQFEDEEPDYVDI